MLASYVGGSQNNERKLTGRFRGQVRPAVVEVVLLPANFDALQSSHVTRSRTQVLQTSAEPDERNHKSQGNFPAKARVRAVTEVDVSVVWSVELKCFGVGNHIRILASMALVTNC